MTDNPPIEMDKEADVAATNSEEREATKGGISISIGIKYQLYCGIYYLLYSDISEFALEWKDEDLVIIDEDISEPSMKFLQCKYIGIGSLHFSKFKNEILDRFLQDYDNVKGDSTKKYLFAVYTNKGLDDNLDKLSKATDQARGGTTPDGLLLKYGRAILPNICKKCDEKIDWFYFLQNLKFNPSIDEDDLIKDIKKFLIGNGSSKPEDDLDRILLYLFKKKTGRITKNELKNELDLDYNLIRVPNETGLPFSTRLDQSNIEKICSNSKNSITESIPQIYQRIEELENIVYLGELTSDQICYNASDYLMGSYDRKRVDFTTGNLQETTGSLKINIKKLKEQLDVISRQSDEIISTRKKFGLQWKV